MRWVFAIIFSGFFSLQCFGYDQAFSQIMQDVYRKYHRKPGDWCDQVKNQIAQVSKGGSVSFLELEEVGVDEDYLDAMALEYCRKHTDAFIAIIWPTVDYSNEQLIYDILGEHSLVAYRKKFKLKNNGPLAVLQAIPEKAPTIEQHFSYYFPPEKQDFSLMCFVVRSPHAEEITKSKKKVREVLNLYPFSIHVNDHHWQCMDLAYLLLNNNSIHFLNHHKHQNFVNFNALLLQYKDFVHRYQLHEWDLCVDGSSVLSAYGIRDCAIDFDFLSVKNRGFGNIFPLDHHNEALERLGFDVESVIYNPKNFFYYKNVKFASLPFIYRFKAVQGREKDRQDLILIEKCVQ
jgi:hypothetical protein